MSDAEEIIVWLRGIHHADEQAARAATCGPWEVGPTFGGRDNRVYVKPKGLTIDSIGTCVIAAQVASMPEYRANAAHIALHDPQDTLARIEAEREILRWHTTPHTVVDDFCVEDGGECTHKGEGECVVCGWDGCVTVRNLAYGYRHRPGWKEEWAP